MDFFRKGHRMTIEHVLVPMDFSEYSEHALDYAIPFASKLQARLTLLHVVESLPISGVDAVTLPQDYLLQLEAGATRHMQSYLTRVTTARLQGDVAVVHGTPFRVITETAKERQADLIIMGTHGRTGLRHLLLGSVAERVVQLAPSRCW
jgi:universal stress protein A